MKRQTFVLVLMFSLLWGALPGPSMFRASAQTQIAKTRIVDRVTDAAGAPRRGVITFILLTKTASGPSGLVAVKPSISATLDAAGKFDISIYPSHSLSPVAYYNVLFKDASGNQENFGVYDVPVTVQTITLSGCKVTDANVAGPYLIPSVADLNSLVATLSTATLNKLNSVSRADGRIQKYDATQGTFVDSVVSESGGSVTVSGPVSATAVTGTSFGGIRDVDVPTTLTSKTLVAPTISGPLTTGNITSTGTVAAANLSGNCSGCTNFPTVITGPSGSSSTGSISNNADSGGAGSGVIDDSINGVTKRRLNHDGTTDLIGGLAAFTKTGLPAPGNAGRIVRVTDDVRGFWADTGTQWVALNGTVVNVKDFGALGTGVNDSSAINNAVTAAGPGGTVLFPAGTYGFTSALTITNVSLRGVGLASVLKPSAAVTTTALSINNPYVGDTYAPIVVENLWLDGALTNNTLGVKIGSTGLNGSITLRNVVVSHFGGASGKGLHIADVVDTSIDKCRIERNGTNVLVEGITSTLPTLTSFRDCYVTLSITGPGVLIKNGYNTTFYKTTIESNYKEGLLEQPGSGENALGTSIYASWFENNWNGNAIATASKFHLTVDGVTGGGTAQIAVRDTFFSGNNTSGRAVWLNRAANSSMAGGVITSGTFGQQAGVIVVNNANSGISFEGYSDGDLDNWISNPDGVVFRGAYQLRKDIEGAWTAWTPTISTNGGATMSATTITTARFKRLGGSRTVMIEINFTTTLSASDSGFIITMPAGLFHRTATTYTPALLFSSNAVVPGGYVTSAGGIGFLTIVGGTVASGAGAGARFTAVFEIQ